MALTFSHCKRVMLDGMHPWGHLGKISSATARPLATKFIFLPRAMTRLLHPVPRSHPIVALGSGSRISSLKSGPGMNECSWALVLEYNSLSTFFFI